MLQALFDFAGSIIRAAGLDMTVVAFVPLLVIFAILLAKQDAGFRKNGNIAAVCCGDMRVYRVFTIFGGASSFTFGWHWAIIAYLVGLETFWGQWFAGYAVLQFVLTIFQILLFSNGIYVNSEDFEGEPVVVIKSHLEGCGMTTGWSPFFWLFFVAKLPLPEGVRRFITLWRDLLMYIDYVVLLPGMIILNVISLLTLRKFTLPRVKHVDRMLVH